MPRSIWKGAISFGMISIPVRLYTATQSRDVSFNQLHADCHSRLKYKKWCPNCDREVADEEIVRGYQYKKDHYAVLTDADLEKLPVASKRRIDLAAFVKQAEIDPVHYEKSYFLEPDEAGLKPYALLMRALEEKGVVGVAKIALRNRESLCVLRPLDGALMLDTLFYADEVRTQDKPAIPEVLVSKQELGMAYSLIDLLEERFDPDRFQDAYRSAVLDLIEAKKQGKQVVNLPKRSASTPDLLSALKASLEAAKKGKREEPKATRTARRRKAS
jgi:DNA end-binding protein Ku